MKYNGYIKILLMTLAIDYASVRPSAPDSDNLMAADHARNFSEAEPFLPIIYSPIANTTQPMLGRDTASRPPMKLGTNPSTYTPKRLDTPHNLGENTAANITNSLQERSNLDEITNNQPEITNEEVLESLSDLFKEKSSIIEEPNVQMAVSSYFQDLATQLEGLNKDLEGMLSSKQLEELADKYPLVVNHLKIENKELSEDYPDIMHGAYMSAPDTGEIRSLSDSLK